MINYQTIRSNQIFLNSAQANSYTNGTKKSWVTFNLNDVVDLDKSAIEIKISLVSAQLPYSFYQINATNNKINVYFGGTTVSYYFPYGNYSVNSFISQWATTIGASYTITFNSITNKFTFNNPYVFYLSDDTNSLFPVIGLKKGTLYINNGTGITSDFCCNFNGITRLNIISSNFSVNNIDSLNQGQGAILASIPINCYQGGMILYNNYTNFKSTVTASGLNTFGIEIVDDFENYIDFNNQDWTMTFQLDVIKDVIKDMSTIPDIYKKEEESYFNQELF